MASTLPLQPTSYSLLRPLRRAWRARLPLLHPSAVNLGVTLWLLAFVNVPFWRALWLASGGWQASGVGFLLTLPLFVLAFVWGSLELLTWGRAARPVLTVLLLAAAGASYFISTYGIVFDRGMLTSLIETHPAEATELMSWRLWGWFALFGGLPVLVLWRLRLRPQGWGKLLLSKAILLAALAAALVVLVAPFFQSYAGLVRNHRELRLKLVPTNVLAAMHSYARAQLSAPDRLKPVGSDAALALRPAGAKPRLLLLVVGETARAANFSLNGYSRPTNPQLASEADLISLRKVQSCGTATAVSLPCMFLDVGRAGFKDGLARRRESLLDVLQRAGIAVLWRDNNSGCKDVCDRVPNENLSALQVPGLCGPNECWDEVLLRGLQERIDRQPGDTVLVLHMKGSHGPAYHLRVPPGFEQFTPVCRTSQLDRCPRNEIVNAYDNSLRYTDHVLARAIDLLRRNSERFDPALIYVSDHGESLGENGLYLHGLPYAMAPDEQTHVPMLLWLPETTQRNLGVNAGCLRRNREKIYSHDYLFHSVLGLMGVRTQAKRAERDLFASCSMS